jgi:ubiquinone/menaquinone biosynthesis C-methylase UbiE
MLEKEIEKTRYQKMSNWILNHVQDGKYDLGIIGANKFELYLQDPFKFYENLLKQKCEEKLNLNQLDLCCGDGLHSFTAARFGANVIALDYSDSSIQIAKLRAEKLNIDIDFRVSDVEILVFPDESFDLVTCVGSLSYVDHDNLLNEIHRILKRGGSFIALDSFNHNIFYKANRFIHFMRGNRTFSTLQRMPNRSLLKKIKSKFNYLDVKYFGIFAFLAPILILLMGKKCTAKILTSLDSFTPFLKNYAFKIVFEARKN